MAQDIRKLIKEKPIDEAKLSKGHLERFELKLDALHENQNTSGVRDLNNSNQSETKPWIKIAAIAVVLIAVSVFGYYSLRGKDALNTNPITDVSEEEKSPIESPQITLGSLSPDLKRVEDFYVSGINLQLASLQITTDNKEVIDGYMEQLAVLDAEYNVLNQELNEVGPTESTITALVDNLKLRLELLFKLKNKLKELKNQNDEQFNSIQT